MHGCLQRRLCGGSSNTFGLPSLAARQLRGLKEAQVCHGAGMAQGNVDSVDKWAAFFDLLLRWTW